MSFYIKRGGTIANVITNNTVSDGLHTFQFMKGAYTLDAYLDGVICTYKQKVIWTLGTDYDDYPTFVGADRRGLYAWNGKIYIANVYETVLSGARCATNHGLGKDMGEVANNVGNEIIFGASAKKIIPAGIFEGSH
jgi:hypothetical protein